MQTQIRIHFRASESSLPYWCLNLNSLLVNSKMTILHQGKALAETRTCHVTQSQPLVKNCHFWYITSKLYRLIFIKTNAILLFWQFIRKPVSKTCFVSFVLTYQRVGGECRNLPLFVYVFCNKCRSRFPYLDLFWLGDLLGFS